MQFCVNLGKSATETPEILREAFWEYSLRWRAAFEWHSRFKAGGVSVADDDRSGRPSTSRTIENIYKKNENSSTKIIAEQSTSPQTQLGSVMEFAGDLTEQKIWTCAPLPRRLFPDYWQNIKSSGLQTRVLSYERRLTRTQIFSLESQIENKSDVTLFRNTVRHQKSES
jgi:hypothetical protein